MLKDYIRITSVVKYLSSNLDTWARLFITNDVVNVSLKFQTLISQICQYFLLKKCEKLLSYLQQKILLYLVIKS